MDITALTGDEAWAMTAGHISNNGKFESVRGIIYQAKVQADTIVYKGGNRSRGGFEHIDKRDFLIAFDAIKILPRINTNNIKDLIPNSLYRKRTPFIGLLHSAGFLNSRLRSR